VWLGLATLISVPFVGYLTLASESLAVGAFVLASSCAATFSLLKGRRDLALLFVVPYGVLCLIFLLSVIRESMG
jgi:hypothetical protein